MCPMTRSVLRCFRQPALRLTSGLQPLNDLVAAQVRSLAGVRCRARRPTRVRGGRPQPQARHRCYLFRWSSRICQVHPRDRRRRRRHRHPPRTRSHSIKSPLPTGCTLRAKSFYECIWSSCPPLFNRRDGNQPQLEHRAASTVPHQGAGNSAPLCWIFAASLGVTALRAFNPNFEPADECPGRIWHHRIAEMIGRRLPCVRMAECRLPFDTLVY